MVKARTVEKDQEQYEKTITELNGRAAKFYKSSITKLFRSRKISKSWQLTQSTDLKIASVCITLFKLLLFSSKFELN